jgi:rhamnosyltransferase
MSPQHRASPVDPERRNICAVIVTYFPDAAFGDRVSRLLPQVDHIVVVDNASEGPSAQRIDAVSEIPRVHVIRNRANTGVACGLNQGIRWIHAQQRHAWALLLDQDTVPLANMLDTLIRAFHEFPDTDRLAMLGCNRRRAVVSPAHWWTTSKGVITSGTLLNLGAAEVVGEFREEFFIDCVDFEFCLRARSMGFSIVEVFEIIAQHAIGNPKRIGAFWTKKRTANHRPWRWYYMMRNNVTLVREYMFKDPAWTMQAAAGRARDVLLALTFEDARLLKLRYMVRGLRDGAAGRFDSNAAGDEGGLGFRGSQSR